MPQFDPSSFASQVFWLIVLFAILYRVLTTLVLPRMTATLELRQRTVSDNLERAEAAKAEAEEVLAAYEKSLADARSQAHETLKAAQDAINEESARREKVQADEIAAKVADAEKRIAAAAEEARAAVGEAVAEVTAELVAGISGRKPTDKQVNDAVAGAQSAQTSNA